MDGSGSKIPALLGESTSMHLGFLQVPSHPLPAVGTTITTAPILTDRTIELLAIKRDITIQLDPNSADEYHRLSCQHFERKWRHGTAREREKEREGEREGERDRQTEREGGVGCWSWSRFCSVLHGCNSSHALCLPRHDRSLL